jgi:PAS domain S-box-containing protein
MTVGDDRSEANAETLAIALDLAHLGLWEFHVDRGVTRCDGRWRELLGLPAGGTYALDDVLARIHPDDRERVRADALRVTSAAAGFDHASEFRVARAEGDVRWLAVRGRSMGGGRAVGTTADVTDARLARDRIDQNARTFERMIEHNPFGIYVVDAGYRIRYATKLARHAFASVEPMIGADIAIALRTIWPEPFASEAIGRFRHTMETGEPFVSTNTVEKRADIGDVEAYDWRLERIVLPDGSAAVACFFYDLSLQVRHARELAAANSRRLLAMRAGNLAAWEYDATTGRNDWDPRLAEMLGASQRDAGSLSPGWREFVHPDDRERVAAAFETALAGRERFECEYRVIGTDGVERWFASTADDVRDESGRIVRLVGMVQDISDRKRAELALLDADRRKDEFLATLSHELRNPLAPIRSATEVLLRADCSPERREWAHGVIQRQVRQMARLLDDLLDVARITRGKLALKTQRVPLVHVVEAAVEAARPLIERKRHRLDVRLPTDDVWIHADPLRLAQVLSNLLTNGAKYTDAGGRLGLHTYVEGDDVRLAVVDDGVGFDPAAAERLFVMFEQAPGVRDRAEGGLGIGLALSRRLVELHGGRLLACSGGMGRGSTFEIRLPGARVAEAAPVSPDLSNATATTPSKLRVLLADDNRDAVETLALVLSLAGHETAIAHGGRRALELAASFRPDVAVLDIGMPDLDGYAVARALRRAPECAGSFLVAVTGWGQETDKAAARDAGFDGHLTKPIDPADLLGLLPARSTTSSAPPPSAV